MGFDFYVFENHELEFFWTLMPSFVLILLAIPSIKVMYFSEEFYLPVLSFKSTGHQWYWSYEGFNGLVEIDVFMEPSFILRLLKTGSILNIPGGRFVRSLVTSSDVIHSWSVPSLGVKVDAIPGRLNQVFFNGNFDSLVVGQCSEICGRNHSFMPIVLMFS
jgi:heme/copper-type cytochrome/quinol oxidase subunit 2